MAENLDDLAPSVNALVAQERRRPGRQSEVSPHLLPLLRHADTLDLSHEPDALALGPLTFDPEEAEPLRAAHGVLLGAVVGMGFWLACFAAIGILLRG